MSRILWLLCAIAALPVIMGFAITLLRSHCDRPMEAGASMMGKVVEYNNDYKIVAFDRKGNQIENNSYVQLPATISLKIEPRLNQAVFEVRGDDRIRFGSEYCDGMRASQENAVINIPDGDEVINKQLVIAAVWAKSYSMGVKITDCLLINIATDQAEDL
jgi:hypothetical protein